VGFLLTLVRELPLFYSTKGGYNSPACGLIGRCHVRASAVSSSSARLKRSPSTQPLSPNNYEQYASDRFESYIFARQCLVEWVSILLHSSFRLGYFKVSRFVRVFRTDSRNENDQGSCRVIVHCYSIDHLLSSQRG
jgi:hypothetical protein